MTAFASVVQAVIPSCAGTRPQVLVLGSGSGIFALAIAEARPDFDVVGVDMCMPAPYYIGARPNCSFRSGVDIEGGPDAWKTPPGSQDLVWCGLLAGRISDWQDLVQQIKR